MVEGWWWKGAGRLPNGGYGEISLKYLLMVFEELF